MNLLPVMAIKTNNNGVKEKQPGRKINKTKMGEQKKHKQHHSQYNVEQQSR